MQRLIKVLTLFFILAYPSSACAQEDSADYTAEAWADTSERIEDSTYTDEDATVADAVPEADAYEPPPDDTEIAVAIETPVESTEDPAEVAAADCEGCAIEPSSEEDAAVADAGDCHPTPVGVPNKVERTPTPTGSVTKATSVIDNFEYYTVTTSTVTESSVKTLVDDEWTLTYESTTVDYMWDYGKCKWEEITRWIDSAHLFRGGVRAQARTSMGDYKSESYSIENGAWVKTMEETSGYDYGYDTNAAGVVTFYIEMEYQNDSRYGFQREMDGTRLDAQGRPMFKVTSWQGTRETVHWETLDGPLPLA